MKRERLVTLSASLWLSLICAGSATAKAPDYGRLPLGFEANAGQTDGRVKFLARGRGYTVFLTGDAAVLALSNTATAARIADRVIRMKVEESMQALPRCCDPHGSFMSAQQSTASIPAGIAAMYCCTRRKLNITLVAE